MREASTSVGKGQGMGAPAETAAPKEDTCLLEETIRHEQRAQTSQKVAPPPAPLTMPHGRAGSVMWSYATLLCPVCCTTRWSLYGLNFNRHSVSAQKFHVAEDGSDAHENDDARDDNVKETRMMKTMMEVLMTTRIPTVPRMSMYRC